MSRLEVAFYVSIISFFIFKSLIGAFAKRLDWHYWYRNFYLKSIHWKFTRWKKKVIFFITHGSVYCEKCRNTKRLHVHHITYKRLGHERMSDLQVICGLCHRRGSGRI